MTIVTKNGKTYAVYQHELPAEWVRQMKKAGYRVKEAADGKSSA